MTAQPRLSQRNCKGRDDFVPPSAREIGYPAYKAKTDELKQVCADCPARTSCLVYALKVRVQGVWGGTTDAERTKLRTQLGITVRELPTVEDFLPKQELIPVACDRKGDGCTARKGGRVRPAVPGDAWDPCACGGNLVRIVSYKPGRLPKRKPHPTQSKSPQGLKRLGEGNGQAKLNPEKVRALREEHRAGVSTRNLAEKYGVNRSTIFNIVARRVWSHVV